MLETLSLIADRLNNEKIVWGVGGSLLLTFYKLINEPNDIDILVDEADANHLNQLLASIGTPKETIRSAPFRTTYFSKYSMNNIDIDVIGGFAIDHSEGNYRLSLQQDSIVTHQKVNDLDIPLCALEDWYVLYLLMPNRKEKATLIENYLRANGVTYPQLLTKALKQPLPDEVKGKVTSLLN